MNERDDAQDAWAEQTTLPLEFDMNTLIARARRFERAIRRRNEIEIGTGAAIAVIFVVAAVQFDIPAMRFGALGVAIGALFVVGVLRTKGRVEPLPVDLSSGAYLCAYRAALLRQARILAWAPVWYVLPLLVPAAVFVSGIRQPGEPFELGNFTLLLVIGAIVSVVNLHAARQLRREASALE
jgi:hypothetical protein